MSLHIEYLLAIEKLVKSGSLVLFMDWGIWTWGIQYQPLEWDNETSSLWQATRLRIAKSLP